MDGKDAWSYQSELLKGASMKFISNNCVAIHLADLSSAEEFYSEVMGFRLISKTDIQLEYDTGHFFLYVNKGKTLQPPIPSLLVESAKDAKGYLVRNGCQIVDDRGSSLYFKDPFGVVYDIIEQ